MHHKMLYYVDNVETLDIENKVCIFATDTLINTS
jgi:hypothetical protein